MGKKGAKEKDGKEKKPKRGKEGIRDVLLSLFRKENRSRLAPVGIG